LIPHAGRKDVVISLSSGHSAEYLAAAVAQGRESYYTGAVATGEPPGQWHGSGIADLGLSGEVDHQDLTALYSHFIDPRDSRFHSPDQWEHAGRLGRPPRRYQDADEAVADALLTEPHATPERRQQLRMSARHATRSAVAFIDATYSVPKSITVVHAAFEAQEVAARRDGDAVAADAWAAHRQAVEAAIWAGNCAALKAFEDKAGYSRVGYHTATSGRWIDAHRFVVASFFQHDSRDHDPQLHIHNAILNRVQASDGQWRTLDSRALHAVRREVAGIAERTTEEHLTRTLGLTFATRPDGKAREILGVPQSVIDLFSHRRRAITAKTAELVAAYRRRFEREPTALELDRLQRQATFATRRVKEHGGEDLVARLDRWDRELRAEVAGGLAQVAEDVLRHRRAQPESAQLSPSQVIAIAMATVQGKNSSWRKADLAAQIADALPDHLGASGDGEVRALIDSLTRDALTDGTQVMEITAPELTELPAELTLADGRSAYQPPSGPRYAMHEHLRAERALTEAAVRTGALKLDAETAQRYLDQLSEEGLELGVDQRQAVLGILTSGAQVESLVGPAGTGKSVVLGRLARAWQDPGLWADGSERRVYGLAASQIATNVLAGEGLASRNIIRWFATQEHLANGRPYGDDSKWALRPGDLIAVDESAMAATGYVARIADYAEKAGAKLLLTGDHRQLAAVGTAGAMSLASGAGRSYELVDVRRFRAEWEREASLRLRDGDPSVLEEYRKHGRVVDGGVLESAQAAAARAWLADTLDDRRSVVLVDTNEQAAQVSAQIRADLVRLGRVEEAGVPLADQTTVGVGDLVQARCNTWKLVGYKGNSRGPVNRETYRVVEMLSDGSMIAERDDGTGMIALPGRYVAEHLALGYASTVHSVQGRTVDTAHAVISPRTGAAAAYVALTRGREANTAYVATVQVPEDSPPGQASAVERRDPLAVLADVIERERDDLSARQVAAESWATRNSTRTAGAWMADATDILSAARTARALDRLTASGRLSTGQRQRLAADPATGQLGRLLRQIELAGRNSEAELSKAVTRRPLDGAESIASVLHSRVADQVGQLIPVGETFAERVPMTDDPVWQRYLEQIAEIADQRARELGTEVAEAEPKWAREGLGPVPAEPIERLAWEQRAGQVAAYRELVDHQDKATALGPTPKAGRVEHYAAWHAAWRALGRPESGRDEAGMSVGQLLVRVRAYQREEAWAPPYVADELDGTSREVARQRQDVTLFKIQADQTDAPDALRRQASEAAELADTLTARLHALSEADAVRSSWYVHTAETRAAADRARAELAARGVDADRPADTIATRDWLAAQVRADDAGRPVRSEVDFADEQQQRAEAVRLVEPVPIDAAETAVPDVREVASAEPRATRRTDEGQGRAASAEETAAAVERAQRALLELRARTAAERRRAAEEVEQVDRSHQQRKERAAEAASVDQAYG
jgi:conjugative relaxase-like TrwC/TraI family protein